VSVNLVCIHVTSLRTYGMVFSLHALVHCMTLKPYSIICVHMSIPMLRYDLSDLPEHFDSFSKFFHLQAWLTVQSV